MCFILFLHIAPAASRDLFFVALSRTIISYISRIYKYSRAQQQQQQRDPHGHHQHNKHHALTACLLWTSHHRAARERGREGSQSAFGSPHEKTPKHDEGLLPARIRRGGARARRAGCPRLRRRRNRAHFFEATCCPGTTSSEQPAVLAPERAEDVRWGPVEGRCE